MVTLSFGPNGVCLDKRGSTSSDASLFHNAKHSVCLACYSVCLACTGMGMDTMHKLMNMYMGIVKGASEGEGTRNDVIKPLLLQHTQTQTITHTITHTHTDTHNYTKTRTLSLSSLSHTHTYSQTQTATSHITVEPL